MLFSSWQFIFVFLPIAVAGFFTIPARAALTARVIAVDVRPDAVRCRCHASVGWKP